MNRPRLQSAAVAALAVLVVGVAAATLGRTVTQEGGAGAGGGSGGAGGGGGRLAQEVTMTGEPFPFLDVLVALVLIALVVGAIRYPLHTLKEIGRMVVLTGVVLAVLWLLLVLLDPSPPPMGGGSEAGPGGIGSIGTGSGASGGGTVVPAPLLAGLAVAALLGVVLLGVLLREAGREEAPTAADEDAETLAAIGRSAGRAADRLGTGDAALDNEVYRAWKEMTDHLDLENHGARTPGEFRAAALDAGMTARDVDALTSLFEAVRYGGARVTDEREERAAEALRRIEERYAEEPEGEP